MICVKRVRLIATKPKFLEKKRGLLDSVTAQCILPSHSAATLKSIDDLGEGMVREGTKCGDDKVP